MASDDVRREIVHVFRRDLIGPLPDRVEPRDQDLQTERLNDRPSRWYLSGFLAPDADPGSANAPAEEISDSLLVEETETGIEQPDPAGSGGAAGDDEQPDAPTTPRRFLPSSIGLTVLLDPSVSEIEVRVSWGDYRTEPPLPESVLMGEEEPEGSGAGNEGSGGRRGTSVDWVRVPRERTVRLSVAHEGRGSQVVVPDSAAQQRAGGGLVLESHARLFQFTSPEGIARRVRAVSVFLVNRRAPVSQARYADVSFVFQARLELGCERGFEPRHDLSARASNDPDLQLADLHYRDVCEFAVGRSTAAGWNEAEAGNPVTRVCSDPLPLAEVERVAPNEDASLTSQVVFDMKALADAASQPQLLQSALAGLPSLYGTWIASQSARANGMTGQRGLTAKRLVSDMATAQARMQEGIRILTTDPHARTAFRVMNLAIERAARRRNAGSKGDPAAQKAPVWRPFQLAFILLNVAGLVQKDHPDRERADLLFFPTGGGKTEAYLGLAAFIIAHRRITGPGLLGAGVAVIMRYTLRLLTLDQLGRAAGVVCALELMRIDPSFVDEKGRKLLGDVPIEIGLWVGSDASPNRLGGKGDSDENTAVGRVRRYRSGKDKRAPAPIKACPWCGTPFSKNSFSCVPSETAPQNLEIRCDNLACDFTGNRALPVLTVDEPIYRRLPAFLIATVDKFASLPWEEKTGAFFGHVDRYQQGVGFFGPPDPHEGQPLGNGWTLDPPDLVIQDELHLISGPLGTVAGLYECAIDRLASRRKGEAFVRPKIVASTATVRRASAQILALFDRKDTQIFPPPGIDRSDSFFARTIPSSQDPARWYMGIAAQGRGPKLVFLRALTTLLAAAQADYVAAGAGSGNPADPYMTALCYFNALRELGGARRIVEDEVRARVAGYGTERRRLDPPDAVFADRVLRAPMELTSRETTDKVAEAKQRLELEFVPGAETVDVALATNMISVGLDITRLGLMLVQGQPKTAAEYIQATSRVGRDKAKPGLVLVVLNAHKPRDRLHYEQFGHFHRTFYRAVEATSVTPWAARALDRALAAVIVAVARHLDPAMTPDSAVVNLVNRPALRSEVRQLLLNRAPPSAIAGGTAALDAEINRIFDAWIDTVRDQTQGGSRFFYAHAKSPHRLLHMPLSPDAQNLSAEHKLFKAGRSMRDVEMPVALRVKDPKGQTIANADDI